MELRAQIKQRKPVFMRQDTHKRKKLPLRWKKPKGIHSKIRHKFKGRGKMPGPGYKSPVKTKGLHHGGLMPIIVSQIKDLQKIDAKVEGVIISKTVGNKKKYEILKKAKDLKLQVLNINMDEHIKKIEDFVASKKKKPKKESKEKKVELPKDTKEVQMDEDQKKEAEKIEKDKVLTKRV